MIVKGKKLYGSDKLAAVAAEDDRAVAEYAYMMAGISDDWGRFKLSPRRILGRAYETRPGVTETMIADWLAIYEKHGLLTLYVAGGTTYAEWTNYMGDSPSQRRYHSCPEPPDSSHKHSKRCVFRDDAQGMPQGRQLGRQRGRQLPTLPSVPSVPSLPITDQRITASAPPAAVGTKSWSAEATDDWAERHGPPTKGSKALGPMYKALGALVTPKGRYEWARVRPVLRHYLATVSLHYLNWSKFESGFLTIEAEMTSPKRGSPIKPTVADKSREIFGLSVRGGDGRHEFHVGDAQPVRRLQPGAEPGHEGSVPGGALRPDGGGVSGGGEGSD